jgi:hypothetical protein
LSWLMATPSKFGDGQRMGSGRATPTLINQGWLNQKHENTMMQ